MVDRAGRVELLVMRTRQRIVESMACAIATVVILIEKVVANAWRLILMSPMGSADCLAE